MARSTTKKKPKSRVTPTPKARKPKTPLASVPPKDENMIMALEGDGMSLYGPFADDDYDYIIRLNNQLANAEADVTTLKNQKKALEQEADFWEERSDMWEKHSEKQYDEMQEIKLGRTFALIGFVSSYILVLVAIFLLNGNHLPFFN